jgi:hypothetical protein
MIFKNCVSVFFFVTLPIFMLKTTADDASVSGDEIDKSRKFVEHLSFLEKVSGESKIENSCKMEMKIGFV